MKRKAAAIICILALAVSFLTACTKGSAVNTTTEETPKNENVLSAYIVKNNKTELLVTAEDGLYFVGIENARVLKDSKALDSGKLEAGMSVLIDFDGAVLETYPMQIKSADTVRVVSETQDKISLYAEAIEYLCKNDESLSELKTIALDFSAVSLPEPQKAALEYVLSNFFSTKTKANIIRSTYKKLEEDGRIKDGSFKDGIIYSIKENDDGSFKIGNYVGPLGAEGFDDCTAKMVRGKWVINYGAYWIS